MYPHSYDEAFQRLMVSNPFYGFILLRMEKVFEDDVPFPAAVGIDANGGRGKLYLIWNDKLAQKYNIDEKAAILEHECLHICHKHITRGRGRNPKLWNIACDMAINCHIQNLPEDGWHPKLLGWPENMPAEWYYQKLLEHADKASERQEPNNHPWSGSGIQNEQNENESGNQKQRKKGRGNNQLGKSANELSDMEISGVDFEADMMVRDAMGQSADQLPDTAISEIELEIDMLMENAYVMTVTKQYGKLPGVIEQMFKARSRAKTDWSILHNFVGESLSTEREETLLRRNKRFPHMPGWRMRDDQLDLVLAVDSSLSISDEQLAAFVANIKKIQETFEDVTMLIITCDTDIHSTYWVRDNDPIPELKFRRGGTDLRPPFNYVEENSLRPSCLIYLTDGFGPAPATPPKYPVLWALTKDGQKPAPWGKEFRIQDEKVDQGSASPRPRV